MSFVCAFISQTQLVTISFVYVILWNDSVFVFSINIFFSVVLDLVGLDVCGTCWWLACTDQSNWRCLTPVNERKKRYKNKSPHIWQSYFRPTKFKNSLHSSTILYFSEGNVLFNNAHNTFYLWLYGVRHMVKDHSDSERGNLLLPNGLFFPINSKGSFICTIPQTG